MKKSKILSFVIVLGLLLLASCQGISKRDLAQHFNSRPAAVTMPYNSPRYIPGSVPEGLPFEFEVMASGELLGTVEDSGGKSGTILLVVDQNAGEILRYYSEQLGGAELANTSDSRDYRVFFPPDGSGATFCGEQGTAVLLEIFDGDNEMKDVRLHYTVDREVVGRTTCGEPLFAIEDFPFPRLAAPPNSTFVKGGGGGGGGGGGSETFLGPMGYLVEVIINSEDSLENVNNHYVALLKEEGWTLLDQNATGNAFESSWDFGFFETRSWLARLTTAVVGDTGDQYAVRLQAVSP